MHSARAFANQYRQTGASSAILDASPHQLVTLMLGGARERVQLAMACLQRGDLARKAQAVSSASGSIGGLNSPLDMKAGGEIERASTTFEGLRAGAGLVLSGPQGWVTVVADAEPGP